MKQMDWFQRKFEFGREVESFPSIIERLSGTAPRLRQKLKGLDESQLVGKPQNKWSIKEQIGHLSDLEPLWQGRLKDILEEVTDLREADLTNKKTHDAGHNTQDIETLMYEFEMLRSSTVMSLKALSQDQLVKSALHPRLRMPMRTIDLFEFVVEHDDHHLVKIQGLIDGFGSPK